MGFFPIKFPIKKQRCNSNKKKRTREKEGSKRISLRDNPLPSIRNIVSRRKRDEKGCRIFIVRYANCRHARLFHAVEDLPLGWPTIRKVEHRRCRIPPLVIAAAPSGISWCPWRDLRARRRRADSARRRNLRGAKPVDRR